MKYVRNFTRYALLFMIISAKSNDCAIILEADVEFSTQMI